MSRILLRPHRRKARPPVNAALQSTNWIFGILFAILSVAALVLAVRQARIRRIGRKRRIKADEEEDRE